MKRSNQAAIAGAVIFALAVLVSVTQVSGEEYDALKGVKSPKTVFDFRDGNPASADLHMKVLQQTYQGLAQNGKTKPETVVIFMGPAVKMISKNREGLSAEELKSLDNIAVTISQLSKDGVKLEVCMIAVDVMKVDPNSILPQIKKVGNGWISEVGYQAQGYSLIPAF